MLKILGKLEKKLLNTNCQKNLKNPEKFQRIANRSKFGMSLLYPKNRKLYRKHTIIKQNRKYK